MRHPDGRKSDARNELNRGTFNTAEDMVIEYHNRLEEFVRFVERGAPEDFLRREAESVNEWRVAAERQGLGQGGGRGGLHMWAKKYFPEIPALEKRIRELGWDIGRPNTRWEAGS